ncbi:hypothetical protein IQ259_25395 [Fortiea sp. LEGE XX443]|uniref:hypothetical protein n=1 Tax=Fortiea sp. LEGE XX443 TaxID=1828611 RepID=UPI001881C034|nr:hypothetical protein [Fortiea sp. LEGE XX443]MBE9008306.1 hypothetical protein [Fortiea sp. LEGE XX443]
MRSPENQRTKIVNNIPSAENTFDYTNTQNLSKSQPMIQVQNDNIITDQDLPYKRLIYGFTLVILTAFLFIAAIYYGIINP